MSPTGETKNSMKMSVIGHGAFSAVTFAAVIIAVVLITLVRLNAQPKEVGNLTPTTTPIPSINQAMSKGSPDAPVTVVEYSDFLCSNCQTFALTVEKELETNYIETGKVRLIYRFIVGWEDQSLRANEAAACADEQGKFWEYHDLLMSLRASHTSDDLTIEKLQDLAQQLGLNMDKFNASLLSGKFETLVNQQDAEGRALGVEQIPTFFVNGIKRVGASSLKVLQDIIDPILEELEK